MGNIFAFVRDSLTNLVSSLGTSRDKAAATFYSMPMLSDEELLNAYRGRVAPSRKSSNIPAFDSIPRLARLARRRSRRSRRSKRKRSG